MLRIQPIFIREVNKDTYLVRFQRLSSDHEECGIGEFELPGGQVEYPFTFRVEAGQFRTGPYVPRKYEFDTAGDGTGSQWLQFSVASFDRARHEGVKISESEVWHPVEIRLGVLGEDFRQAYDVTFERNDSRVNKQLLVSGDDDKVEVCWDEQTFTVKKGLRWTTDDMESPNCALVCAVAMLHAARNFIYGPDKEWEPAGT